MDIELDIDFQDYKKFTNEEKELWNFELKKSQGRTLDDVLKHQKITNGRVRRLEIWKWVLTGGITIVAFLFPYLEFLNK